MCLFILLGANACFADPTILVLGDSLSAAFQIPPEEGWVALLQAKLKTTYPQAVVINSSIVGDTTANGLQRLPSLLTEHKPDIIIIELGGNDGLRGLPVQSIKANLDAMIDKSLKARAKILLIGMRIPPNYGSTYTQQFEQTYQALSIQHQVPLIPFFLDNVALNPELMFPDKIHPNAKAQKTLLDTVWPKLEPLLSEVERVSILNHNKQTN